MKLQINPTFKNKIPPLSEDEYRGLEESIIAEGCLDSIKVWNGTILDGHNRYSICQKHGISFEITEIELDNENEALIWIIKNQFNRRNINSATRSLLALELEPLIKEQAKRNQQMSQGQGIKGFPTLGNLKQVNTEAEVAKLAGVSKGTIYKVKRIKEEGTDDVKKQMLDGQISINKAYSETFPSTVNKHCATCGKEKPSDEFFPGHGTCKECKREIERKNYAFKNVDCEAILESLTKKKPSEEGNGKCLDNTIITEFLEVVGTFRRNINKYLYMPSSFSEISSTDQPAIELIKAKNDIETIISMMKE